VEGLPKGYSQSTCDIILPSFFRSGALLPAHLVKNQGFRPVSGESAAADEEICLAGLFFNHPTIGGYASTSRGGYCFSDWFNAGDIVFVAPEDAVRSLKKVYTFESHTEHVVGEPVPIGSLSHVCVLQRNLARAKNLFAHFPNIRVMSIEAIELIDKIKLHRGELSIPT
jgi:hypothetical protein